MFFRSHQLSAAHHGDFLCPAVRYPYVVGDQDHGHLSLLPKMMKYWERPGVTYSNIILKQLQQADAAPKSHNLPALHGLKIALIIGNDAYGEAPLRNPVNDAEDMAAALRLLGFEVIQRTNANQREMEDAVNGFFGRIRKGSAALFYFSGHGVQVKGENYLIPVGENISTESDIRYKAVNAGYVLGKMEASESRTNIIILDACRNNPLKGFRSLSNGLTMMDALGGSFVAYATAPGSVAADGAERNGVYTKHLLEAMRKKEVPIEQAFKQVLRNVEKETGGCQIPLDLLVVERGFLLQSLIATVPGAAK